MAKLSDAARNKLPRSDNALKSKNSASSDKQKGSYPIPDRKHARAALALGKMHASPAQLAKIKAAVRKKYPDMAVDGKKSTKSKAGTTRKGARKRG